MKDTSLRDWYTHFTQCGHNNNQLLLFTTAKEDGVLFIFTLWLRPRKRQIQRKKLERDEKSFLHGQKWLRLRLRTRGVVCTTPSQCPR